MNFTKKSLNQVLNANEFNNYVAIGLNELLSLCASDLASISDCLYNETICGGFEPYVVLSLLCNSAFFITLFSRSM